MSADKPVILGVKTGDLAFTVATMGNGRKVLVLALAHAELERMRAGAVIHVAGEEVDVGAIDIYVMPFADVAAIKEQMAQVQERYPGAVEKKRGRDQ